MNQDLEVCEAAIDAMSKPIQDEQAIDELEEMRQDNIRLANENRQLQTEKRHLEREVSELKRINRTRFHI